ncbi:MAG TPA: hypothetical protein GX745_01945 [Clostridiales bacterium]|nr:hypothetical protein [Clostridiales bacterium]
MNNLAIYDKYRKVPSYKRATFRESDHTYWLGDKRLISVTQLLKKHELSPNYSAVSESVLTAAAERGTMIHKEVERYIECGITGFTSEFSDYIDISDKLGLYAENSELIVNDNNIAGTLDICAKRRLHGKEINIIADIKTTASLNKESVRWQLSIYEYLHEQLYGYGFDELYIFHLRSSGKSKAHKVDRISRSELLRLFECERKGEIYAPPSIDDRLLEEAEKIEVDYQIAKAKREEVTLRLLKNLKEKNIKSTESAALRITYIPPSIRQTFDAKAFEREHPDLKAKYMKETKTKESLRLSLKKQI